MATETLILHSDLNCYYASVEMNEHPELRGKKVAVCGSTENRHGIVLTASYPAKRSGVKTGMANWQAKQACPDLIMVDPHYDLYLRYSKIVRSIYKRYADCIEPFGMDENWISIPCCKSIDQDGLKLAEDIRKTVREETGLTVSIGVSFSKIFAKIIDMQTEINADIDRLVDLKSEIMHVIKAVKNPEHQTLLELRYLCFKSWEYVAEQMGYNVRHIYRLHDEAVEQITIPESCH